MLCLKGRPKKVLDFFLPTPHNKPMEIVPISPEALEIANSYLATGSLQEAARQLSIAPSTVAETLSKREVKTYIDQVFLDQGYRNRSRLAELLDRVIDSKIEEAEETGIYSSKDLADLIDMAHKHRMAELKLQASEQKITHQTNVQVNNEGPTFGDSKYGELMKTLMTWGPND